ncbi:hypothetical protein GP486_002729 [Trichoglossum hirsutum]|uniref:Calcineurin-like phosphoesterase domain-containing protein n=1 Tax=Trichoglossum hirsutum TaxID=265104 RepID=A0A9P8LEN7_9PEZI|nr:hypothetical protein GP486_002729 [Trichoglossum hirsutum]
MPILFPRPSTIFDPPTTLDHFLSSPIKFFTRHVHRLFIFLRAPPALLPHNKPAIRVICISDTHNDTQDIPPGDLLIHAGDLTNNGTVLELQAQIDWLKSLPHMHKVVICGNHDSFFDPASRLEEDAAKTLSWGEIQYLENSSVALTFPSHGNRRLVIYGAPQIPRCGGSNFAFQYQRDEDRWTGTIPPETDVLVTHPPPKYHLDLPAGLGCAYLLQEVWRIRPTLHIFGHVHSGHGKEPVFWDEEQRIYERLCVRKDRGVVLDLIDVWGWLDVWKLVCHGVGAVLWTRVWGGDSSGSLMVNAALSYRSTGKLRNPAQVVEI